MKKSNTNEQVLSRRKALGRIGLFATAAYTVPAFATLSMAHASSGASGTSGASSNSGPSMSGPSMSGPSGAAPMDPAAPTNPAGGPNPVDVQAMCGLPGDAGYGTCLTTNGWDGFVAP